MSVSHWHLVKHAFFVCSHRILASNEGDLNLEPEKDYCWTSLKPFFPLTELNASLEQVFEFVARNWKSVSTPYFWVRHVFLSSAAPVAKQQSFMTYNE